MGRSKGELIAANLRSIAASIPGLASAVQAWSEYEGILREERIEKFFDDVREELRGHEQRIARLEAEALRTEMPPLLERSITCIQREPSPTKRRLHARCWVNLIVVGPGRTYHDKVHIIDTLDSLAEEDIQILSMIGSGSSRRVAELVSTDTAEETRSASDRLWPAIVSLSKLAARGLVFEVPGSMGDATPFWSSGQAILPWTDHWGEKRFEILPFGVILLGTIHRPGDDGL